MPHHVNDDDIARLRVALARIARLVDRQVSGDGMTRTQLSVLGTVARLESVGMGELADVEGLNPTMLSRLVGKLADAGLVARSPGTLDRRAVHVEITAAGTALHQRLRRERTALFAERLAQLPDEQATAVLAALDGLESLAAHMRRPPDDGLTSTTDTEPVTATTDTEPVTATTDTEPVTATTDTDLSVGIAR